MSGYRSIVLFMCCLGTVVHSGTLLDVPVQGIADSNDDRLVQDVHDTLSVNKRATGDDNLLCDCVEYTFHNKPSKKWNEAKVECEKVPGRTLAVIKDKDTFTKIRSHIQANNLGETAVRGYWIGLKYDAMDHQFYWIDGEPFENCDPDFNPWAAGQPNHKVKYGQTQECVQLWKKKDFKWDDDYCYNTKAKSYICMQNVCPGDQGCTAFVDPTC